MELTSGSRPLVIAEWREANDELKKENARLREALKEAVIRIKDLFHRHERPTYRTNAEADRDLELILSGPEAALRGEKP